MKLFHHIHLRVVAVLLVALMGAVLAPSFVLQCGAAETSKTKMACCHNKEHKTPTTAIKQTCCCAGESTSQKQSDVTLVKTEIDPLLAPVPVVFAMQKPSNNSLALFISPQHFSPPDHHLSSVILLI